MWRLPINYTMAHMSHGFPHFRGDVRVWLVLFWHDRDAAMLAAVVWGSVGIGPGRRRCVNGPGRCRGLANLTARVRIA